MENFLRRTPLVLIVACGLGVYANTFDNGFHYDDGHAIADNPHLRSLKNLPGFFADPGAFSAMPEARMYRPLLLVTFALNYAAGGLEVWGYHLVNLGLHLANAWLVWLVGCRLAGKGAWLASLLFLLHPVASEPVNYLSSRSALLATFFWLLGWWWLMRGALGEGGARPHLWVALCAAAALASKEIAFTFPLAAALYIWLLAPRRAWSLLVAPGVLALLYLGGTWAIVGRAMGAPVRSLTSHWATQVKAAVFYLWTLVEPVRLSAEPQFAVAGGWAEWPVILPLLLLGSLAAVLARTRARMALFCTGWATLALLPAAAVPLNILVNENRLYLPLAALALGLGTLRPWLPGHRAWLLALLPLVPLCLQRNRAWQDEVSLWADAVAKGPAMARPHVNLGKALLEAGQYPQAIAASRRALELDPELALAHYNIGTAHLHLSQLESAVASYQRALEIRPDLVEARNNLGNAYLEQGKAEAALAEYRRALAVQADARIHHNMGKAQLDLGRLDSAAAAFSRSLALEPANPEAHRGLIKALRGKPEEALRIIGQAQGRWPQERDFWLLRGEVLAGMGREGEAREALVQAGLDEAQVQLHLGDEARRQGRWPQAQAHYEGALRAGRESGRIFNALGECLEAQGRNAEALAAFRRAAQLEPQMAAAYANIGRVNLRYDRPLEAAAALERALGLDPAQTGLWSLLGAAQARAGRFAQALAAYQQALKLDPTNAQVWCDQGTALLRLGRPEEALTSYGKYLALTKAEDPLTQQVRLQVEELRRHVKK